MKKSRKKTPTPELPNAVNEPTREWIAQQTSGLETAEGWIGPTLGNTAPLDPSLVEFFASPKEFGAKEKR